MSWNQIDALHSKLILMFLMVVLIVNFEAPLYSSCFRQEVDGTYILELHKDEKKGEAKATIVMDFCTEVVRVSSDVWFYSSAACILLDAAHNYVL
jgi:hypothetical protein